MFNKQELLKNVKDSSEKILFAKALDRALQCLKCFEPSFSDFFDPHKVSELMTIVGNTGLNTMVYGGYEGCERCLIGFFPDYMEPKEEDFPIAVIEVTYNGAYSKALTHREFLGSVLGLGITRDKVGDIIIQNEGALIVVEKSIADYIAVNLERVSRTKVATAIVDNNRLSLNSESIEMKKTTVASLRLDAVLSAVFNLSRGKVADYIKAEKAFVNWNVADSGARVLKEGDVITLRGIGRTKLVEVCGKTKKDRFLIEAALYR